MPAKSKLSDLERFMQYVSIDEESGCWIWTGYTNVDGYGMFCINRKAIVSHRVSYELRVEPNCRWQAAGSQLPRSKKCVRGPLCPHRRCVNPDHLDVVTLLENLQRAEISEARLLKTHCPRGHAYEPKPSYLPTRRCRICSAAWKRKKRSSLRQVVGCQSSTT